MKTLIANVEGRRILYAFPRKHGDPRTTGRSETASERRRRKREESRGHRPRRNPIGAHAASSSVQMSNATLSVDGGPEIPVKDMEINEADGQCKGRTKTGRRCKRRTDDLYCTTHKEQNQ